MENSKFKYGDIIQYKDFKSPIDYLMIIDKIEDPYYVHVFTRAKTIQNGIISVPIKHLENAYEKVTNIQNKFITLLYFL